MWTARFFFACMILTATNPAAVACPKPTSDVWLGTNKPVLGAEAKLTSTFGMRLQPLLNEMRMHTGIDWAAATGTPIGAAGQGEIVSAGRQGYNGNTIVVDHGNGRQTLYAHLSEFSASVGDCVEIGTVIGKVGATGLASGPVLHFEVLENGKPIDPLAILTSLPVADGVPKPR